MRPFRCATLSRGIRQSCQVFTAAEPAGVGTDKYDTTAVAMIALLKYGTGVPFNRMERLETQLGFHYRPPPNGS